uniref:Uncharacterized protein n=1 Tax=Trichogramma kaykai TaxID=54128 RepID=A0ABD2XP14_9HYME
MARNRENFVVHDNNSCIHNSMYSMYGWVSRVYYMRYIVCDTRGIFHSRLFFERGTAARDAYINIMLIYWARDIFNADRESPRVHCIKRFMYYTGGAATIEGLRDFLAQFRGEPTLHPILERCTGRDYEYLFQVKYYVQLVKCER